jgi:hypothetical protein
MCHINIFGKLTYYYENPKLSNLLPVINIAITLKFASAAFASLGKSALYWLQN